MKKISALAACAAAALLFSFTAGAIDNPYPKGTMIVSATVGPKLMFGIHSGVTAGIAPAASFDYVITDALWVGHLTAGVGLGGHVMGNIMLDYGVEKVSSVFLASRVGYGINLGSGFEVHVAEINAMGLYTDQVLYQDGSKKYDKPTHFQFKIGALIGARYHFSEHLAAVAELQTIPWSSIINLGVSYKF